MIITCKKRISFLWIVLATLPWVAVIFKDKVMAIAFVFSMRKFVENPAALTFLLTLPLYISWVVPPVVNFVADRIWTRWGRRKPFITVAWVGTMTSMALMPLAPSFGWLLAAYMVFCIFNDLGGPVESLKMEIVPPAQRGTSQAVMEWISQVAVLVFWVVAIGRFDEMTSMFGVAISGEEGLYWSVSIGMVVMLLFLTLGIKETNPHSALRGQPFSFASVFGGLFSRHLWPVYILAFSVAILGTGLGAFNQLLITEQWGYTKQDQGLNIAIGGIINLFLIPLLGLLATRVGRGSVYVGLVIAGIVVNVAMYAYYNFVLYDARPTILEMVVFGEMLSVIGVLTRMALTPFQYDFIPRNELGTYAAGSGLVAKGTNILTANLMGLFVWWYASLFLGPPGEMVRVTLREDTRQQQVQALLDGAGWSAPQTGVPLVGPKLTAQAWYATGAALDHGRGFEIRLQNDDSAKIRARRDLMEDERGKYKARRGYATTRLAALLGTPPSALPALATRPAETQPGNDLPEARAKIKQAEVAAAIQLATLPSATPEDRLRADMAAEWAGEQVLAAAIARCDAELDRRSAAFRTQLEAVLSTQLLRDGEQVLSAAAEPALVATFPLTARPDGGAVERTNDRLRRAEPDLIDVRVVPAGDGLALELSGRLGTATPEALADRLRAALASSAAPALQAAMPWPPGPPTLRQATGLRLDLRILEDPLDRHPSPITQLANRVMSLVMDPATAERRLNALGRNLRRPGFVEHATAGLVPGDDYAVRLLAIVGTPPEGTKLEAVPEPVRQRLGALLAPAAADQAATLYALAVPAAKEQRMTVARPVLSATFAKQQYDYLAGFIAIFVLQLVGLVITFTFLHLVRIGWVRRRGAEEAEAIQ